MEIRLIDAEMTLPIRHRVLWPGKPRDFCRVPGDADALHFGGFLDGQLVSVASIFLDGQQARLRKFATLSQFQGRGLGSKILAPHFGRASGAGHHLFLVRCASNGDRFLSALWSGD